MKNNINEFLNNSQNSSLEFMTYDQKKVDTIVKAVYLEGMKYRVLLAKMAVKETGMGKWEDKVIKNILSTKYIYEDIKNLKTVGVISQNPSMGITEIAQPVGTVLALIPVTNPTSTVMFKILIALKTRNPILISLPSMAQNVCAYTAEILYNAAIKAGAPKNCIQWVKNPDRETTRMLMKDRRVAMILATGSDGLVNAAYSSGTPALGVGSGNVPVLIENSADINFAIKQIMISKTFDNGTICASEQAIVIEKKNTKKALEALKNLNAYLVDEEYIPQLENTVYDKKRGRMASDIVGKSAHFIAKKAGFIVPKTTSLLVTKQNQVGEAYPLSLEILAPVIALYEADDFNHALSICKKLNLNGGMGHTASIFSNDDLKITQYSMMINAGRIIVNTPSAQGAVGGLYNKLTPSLTLGCGTAGRNSTTDNITAKHLINIQRIAKPLSSFSKPQKISKSLNKVKDFLLTPVII